MIDKPLYHTVIIAGLARNGKQSQRSSPLPLSRRGIFEGAGGIDIYELAKHHANLLRLGDGIDVFLYNKELRS